MCVTDDVGQLLLEFGGRAVRRIDGHVKCASFCC